jgi:RNA polymerase sigma-70 factor, ECF subfamily
MKRGAPRIFEEYLVASAQAGSQDALNQLALRWTPRLLRHAAHLLGSAEPAPDVVQDTWISVMKGIRHLNDPAHFPGWVYAIATRRCADVIRARTRYRRIETQLASDAEIASSEIPNTNDQYTEVEKAMATLSGEQRALISMYYTDELGIDEISAALNIPTGTVKSRLFTARLTLKTVIERKDHE